MNPAPGFKSSAGLARALALQHSPRPVWGREGRVSGSPDEFDLDAAFLRRSEGDLRAFMEALAVRLEGAQIAFGTAQERCVQIELVR